MSLIEASQFLAITDRLAAQYEILGTAYTESNAAATKAYLDLGSRQHATAEIVGDNGLRIVLEAVDPGVEGNSIRIESVSGTPNQTFSSAVFGQEWVIRHETDSNGDIITPLDVLYGLCTTHSSLKALFTVKAIVFPAALISDLPMVLLLGASPEETDFDLIEYLKDSVFYQATPFFGGYAENALRVEANTTGYSGRTISLTIPLIQSPNQTLGVDLTGNDIVVTLASDGLSQITSTAADVVQALNQYASTLVTATLQYGQGTATLDTLEKTYLGGNYTGGFETLVLSCSGGVSNRDVVGTMLDEAQFLDANLNLTNVSNANTGWANFISGIEAHFATVGQADGILGFMEDNDIRVHQNFANIYSDSTGGPLNAIYVFRKDQVDLGTATITGGSLVLSNLGSLGAGSGVVSSTNYAAQALEAVLTPGTLAAYKAILTGNAGLTFTASSVGTEGNTITVEYREPASHPSSLWVEAYPFVAASEQRQIIVHPGTNSGGDVISTAAQVKAAVESHPVASGFVSVALIGDGTGVVEAVAETALANGLGVDLKEDIHMSVTLRTGATDTTTVNMVRFSSDDPPGTRVLIAPRAVRAMNSQLRIVAVEPGTPGNDITIALLDPGAISSPLTVEVLGKSITVYLATNGSGTITTTLTTLKAALDFYAQGLVFTDLLASGSTTVTPAALGALTGGEEAPRAFAVTSVAFDSQNLGLGTDSDVIKFYQRVERQISL